MIFLERNLYIWKFFKSNEMSLRKSLSSKSNEFCCGTIRRQSFLWKIFTRWKLFYKCLPRYVDQYQINYIFKAKSCLKTSANFFSIKNYWFDLITYIEWVVNKNFTFRCEGNVYDLATKIGIKYKVLVMIVLVILQVKCEI